MKNVVKVKGHITEEDSIAGNETQSDRAGNDEADRLAGIGAEIIFINNTYSCNPDGVIWHAHNDRIDAKTYLILQRLLAIARIKHKDNQS